MKYLLILFTIMSFSALAGDFKFTHGGTYNMNLPDYATSYDGKKRDVSEFYKTDMPQLYLGGRYTSNDKSTTISTTYDNGFDSAKLDIQKSVRIGIQHHIITSQQSYISVGGSYKFGGDTKHTSCKDNYNREYYCGNATAWSDFDQKGSQDGEDYNVGVRFTFSF